MHQIETRQDRITRARKQSAWVGRLSEDSAQMYYAADAIFFTNCGLRAGDGEGSDELGECRRRKCSVTFSRENQRIVCGSSDQAIRIQTQRVAAAERSYPGRQRFAENLPGFAQYIIPRHCRQCLRAQAPGRSGDLQATPFRPSPSILRHLPGHQPSRHGSL